MANSVDPDQTLHSVASDLGSTLFAKGLAIPILRVIMVPILQMSRCFAAALHAE